jgi:hypothetical protein
MIINDFFEKSKIGLIILLSITAGLGAWQLLAIFNSKTSITMEYMQYASVSGNVLPTNNDVRSVSTTTGAFVASKNGKSYYLPTCSAANRILEKNKVWFASREAAEKAGFVPAKNCKGL